MKPRNPFALKARQRKAGAMAHKNAPRGGALNQLPAWSIECSRCGETIHSEPARGGSTEVQLSFGICPSCDDRKTPRG